LSRNKFEFNACDWLSRSAAGAANKSNMADGENKHEFEVDHAGAIIAFGTPALSLQSKQPRRQKAWKNCRKNTTFRLAI